MGLVRKSQAPCTSIHLAEGTSVLYLTESEPEQHLAQRKGQANTLPRVNRERLMLDASFSMSLLVLVSFTRSLPACTQPQDTRSGYTG